MIADITRLARTPPSSNPEDYILWLRRREDFHHWKSTISSACPALLTSHIAELYTEAIQILFLKAHPELPRDGVIGLLEESLQCGMTLIEAFEFDEWFAYYRLWPVIVIGSLAVDHAERQKVRAKLCAMSESRQQGPVILAQHRLERVWALDAASHGHDRDMLMLTQLTCLLNGQ